MARLQSTNPRVVCSRDEDCLPPSPFLLQKKLAGEPPCFRASSLQKLIIFYLEKLTAIF